MIRINKLSLYRLREVADTLPAAAIESRTYLSGEHIFEEDTYAKGLYYIESGTILLTTTQETGMEIVINAIDSNNFIGFIPLIQKTRFTSTAIALQDNCRVMFIPKIIFQEALSDNRFLNGFTKILCELIKSNEKQALDFKTKNVSARLASVLVSLNKAFKKSVKDPFPIIALKKKDLASLIGVAPETLSRRLAEFENEGLIELHIKGIKLKDKTRICFIADGVE